jgi:hypothetical protein
MWECPGNSRTYITLPRRKCAMLQRHAVPWPPIFEFHALPLIYRLATVELIVSKQLVECGAYVDAWCTMHYAVVTQMCRVQFRTMPSEHRCP